MNKEEFIQNYIANRLSEEEKEKVEALLKTDVELKEIYEGYKEMAVAFRLSKTEALKKRFQEIDEQSTTTRKTRFALSKWSKIIVAAVFILGVFFMVRTLQSKEDLYASYFEICPNTYLPVTRGEEAANPTFEAFKAYENNDFKTAASQFEHILKTSDNKNIRFYYGMSLLNQEQYDLALEQLFLVNKESFDYQLESLWYTALIKLKKQQKNHAKQILTAIQQLNSDFKSEEIKTLLEQL